MRCQIQPLSFSEVRAIAASSRVKRYPHPRPHRPGVFLAVPVEGAIEGDDDTDSADSAWFRAGQGP